MIRPLEADDRDDWLRLWSGYQTFYKVEIASEATNRTFERLLDPAEPMFAALDLHDGRPVGLVPAKNQRPRRRRTTTPPAENSRATPAL